MRHSYDDEMNWNGNNPNDGAGTADRARVLQASPFKVMTIGSFPWGWAKWNIGIRNNGFSFF